MEKYNKSLYCIFHKDVGYLTDDYNDLNREIEYQIKQGNLKQFVQQARDA